MFGEAADFGLSPGFERTDMEGILGLGLPQEGQALPLFHNGYKQGVLPSHSFAMYLGGAQDKDNFLSLGGYDPKYNISEFKYFPLYTPLRWIIQMKGISFQGTLYIPETPLLQFNALIDTGKYH